MWVVINGKEHIKFKNFDDAVSKLNELVESNPDNVVKLFRDDEYVDSGNYKRKRGKKS